MEKKIIQSIDRALQVFELFSLEKPEWGVTEISKALNIYKSNVHNVLTTLAEKGFVIKDSKTDKYKLGIKFFELGSIVIKNMDLRKIAHPYIEELFKEFNETVHLGILDKGRVVSIEREESNKGLCSHIEIGKRAPLHCTAVGKAIMAYLHEEEINFIIKEKGLEKHTQSTITEKEVLIQDLEKIRVKGYAIDNMEHEVGIRCIAAPIYDYAGKVIASMSISGPSVRITVDKEEGYAKILVETCRVISKELGYLEGRER